MNNFLVCLLYIGLIIISKITTVQAITYDSLRMVVNVGNSFIDVQSIAMRVDQDTTLMTLGMRSDNKQWEQTNVEWSSTGLQLSPPTPSTIDSSFHFSPLSTGTGIIVIGTPSVNGHIYDTVSVTISPGLPYSIRCYNYWGNPIYDALPDTITVESGHDTILVAKVFDIIGDWLSLYEHSGPASTAMYWQNDDSINATPHIASGPSITFNASLANKTYRLRVTLLFGSMIVNADLFVYVVPDIPTDILGDRNIKSNVVSRFAEYPPVNYDILGRKIQARNKNSRAISRHCISTKKTLLQY